MVKVGALGVTGLLTVSIAVVLMLAEPLSVELMLVIVFVTCSAVPSVTVTAIVQVGLAAGKATPDTLTLLELAAAVTVPPQPLLVTLDAAILRLPGNVSVKLTLLKSVALGLCRVKVRVVVPPVVIVVGLNALANVGASGVCEFCTVNIAEVLGLPAPLSVELILVTVLVTCSAVPSVTVTAMVQVGLAAGSDTPDTLTLVELATAVTVPLPQLLTVLLDAAILRLPGNVSVKLTLVKSVALGLCKVKVSVEVPFVLMVVGLNALANVGRDGCC